MRHQLRMEKLFHGPVEKIHSTTAQAPARSRAPTTPTTPCEKNAEGRRRTTEGQARLDSEVQGRCPDLAR